MAREVIIDTETTGLDPKSDRVIEICALEMENMVLTGRKFCTYLNPDREVGFDAYRVHGISTDFLQDKPRFKEIADEFLNFIKGAGLVIHNAPFDISFLNSELSRIGLQTLELAEVTDTLKIARKKFPGSRVNLDSLCKRFKIDNSARKYHGALLDATLLSYVYVELIGGRQDTFTIDSVSRLKEAVSTPRLAEDMIKKHHVVIFPTEDEIEKHKVFLAKIADMI